MCCGPPFLGLFVPLVATLVGLSSSLGHFVWSWVAIFVVFPEALPPWFDVCSLLVLSLTLLESLEPIFEFLLHSSLEP